MLDLAVVTEERIEDGSFLEASTRSHMAQLAIENTLPFIRLSASIAELSPA